MITSLIIILLSVMLILTMISITILKSIPEFAVNDSNNYVLVCQKWITSILFMTSLVLFLITISLAVNQEFFLAIASLLGLTIFVIIYSEVYYKTIIVTNNIIIVERLMRKTVRTKFSSIKNAQYYHGAKITIKLYNKVFDVSFNYENFYNFYKDLLKNGTKFKTMKIPEDQSYIVLSKFGMTIIFPKTMFREHYQDTRYLRNSNYLFSARSLDNNQYIEAYSKESELDQKDFVELIENDLKVNMFDKISNAQIRIEEFDFTLLKSNDTLDKTRKRCALVYKDYGKYLIIYADYNKDEEDAFIQLLMDSIHKTTKEEIKTRFSRI